MKRPDVNDYRTELYTVMIETYADQLENELAEWKAHMFDDDLTFSDGHGNEILLDDVCEDDEDNSPESEGGLTLPDRCNSFNQILDGLMGQEDPEDEDPGIVYEKDFSPEEMMFYMLDLIGEMVADLKEMVSDEDC